MVERTDDGRYVVVDGRRWRAADPSLDEEMRQALVDALMAARRDVKRAKTTGNETALQSARARVNDAKVALGERGRPWWETQTTSDLRQRREATERTLDQTF